MKNYIGISRDHSASMTNIARPAMNDYNQTISGLTEAATAENIDTIISVVRCGDGYTGNVAREITNSNLSTITPLTSYSTQGRGTPLFDSVGDLIEMFEATPDAKDPEVSFIVMAITDGQENASRIWTNKLINKIKELQATDRWTFVFRVPRGEARTLINMGIHPGNILEWELTASGMLRSTQVTNEAFTKFYSDLKTGVKSTKSFYTTDLTNIDISKIKNNMTDIKDDVQFWRVPIADHNIQIRDFCEKMSGAKFAKGAAFYQLVKNEKEVQDYKIIAIKDINTGSVYVDGARQILGLPQYGTISLHPGDHSMYEIFIQSTSTNRKLPEKTLVMYWKDIGIAYKSGKSSK